MLAWLASCTLAADVHTADLDLPRPGQDPLPVRATWSDGKAKMPVIVFSHGLGGSREAYAPLATAWAEHGYLVVQPTHPDSLADKTRADRVKAITDKAGYLEDQLSDWDQRPVDVSFVIDHLDALGPAGVPLARVDREHVGIGGHSFGANTSALCGGLVSATGRTFLEPRADAILMLSPQGPGPGTAADGYAHIGLPVLMVTGSEDRSPITGQGPDWRLQAWNQLTTPDRWLLYLDGATHALGGIAGKWFPGAGRDDPELRDAVIDVTTTFWDATLKGDKAARRRLDEGVTKPASARVHLSHGAPTPTPAPVPAAK